MHSFGLKAGKISDAISKNNLRETIVQHMAPHVQNYLQNNGVPVNVSYSGSSMQQQPAQPVQQPTPAPMQSVVTQPLNNRSTTLNNQLRF